MYSLIPKLQLGNETERYHVMRILATTTNDNNDMRGGGDR